jgi:hypothetical protein
MVTPKLTVEDFDLHIRPNSTQFTVRGRVHFQIAKGEAVIAKFEYTPLQHKTLVMSNVQYFGSRDLTQTDITELFRSCEQTLKDQMYVAMDRYLTGLAGDLFGRRASTNSIVMPLEF